jgi:hypothetical protein
MINTGFLIITFDFSCNSIEVNKGIYKSPQQGLLLLVIHHLDVLPSGVRENVTEKGYFFGFAR